MFSSKYADFRETSPDAVIFKTKDFFYIFYCVSGIYMKWKRFSEKNRVFKLKYFRNYWLQKRVLFKCLKSLTSEQLSVIDLLTGTKYCLNLHSTTIILFFLWIWDKLSWKKSALVLSKILGLFVNTLTAEYKYSRSNMQTLAQHVQTPLSLKKKTFSGFFISFLKCTTNGEHFQKNRVSSTLSISKIIDPKRGGYLNAWKALLQNSFR